MMMMMTMTIADCICLMASMCSCFTWWLSHTRALLARMWRTCADGRMKSTLVFCTRKLWVLLAISHQCLSFLCDLRSKYELAFSWREYWK